MESYAVRGKIARPKKKQKGLKSKKQLQLESVTPYVNVGNKDNCGVGENQKVPVDAELMWTCNQKVMFPQEAYDKNSGLWSSGTFWLLSKLCREFSKIFTESIHANGYTYTTLIPSQEFFEGEDLPVAKITH